MIFPGGRIVRGGEPRTGSEGFCVLCKKPRVGHPLCDKHEKRRERYGSPTAMRCFKCKAIFDNAITKELSSGMGWRCEGCAVKYCGWDACDRRLKDEKKEFCSRRCFEQSKARMAEEEAMLTKMAIDNGFVDLLI